MAVQQSDVYAEALETFPDGAKLPRGWGDIANLRLEIANMASTLKPGTPAPKSGQYRNNSTGTEVTGTRGNPLPPTPKSGQNYTLVDPTRHKGKR